ncbi:uncharacterized protein LOC142985379, partial [Anticarsia gemmatalis]|uniref:uncharacterized protein LOC142985379 n=1 Tax=Anticarsia gemmatalis TaxID=129554 RepID=UPI003F75CEEE
NHSRTIISLARTTGSRGSNNITLPTISVLQASRIRVSTAVGEHFDKSVSYGCGDCTIVDIVCRGESALPAGRVSVIPQNKVINFNFPSYEDANSGVYIAIFKKGDIQFSKIVAVLDSKYNLIRYAVTITPENLLVPPPKTGEQFEQEIQYKCSGTDCTVENVTSNGVLLMANTRRSNSGSVMFYALGDNSIIIRITEYTKALEGIQQAVFMVDGEPVTKTLMEIGTKVDEQDGGGGGGGGGSGGDDGTDTTTAAATPDGGSTDEGGVTTTPGSSDEGSTDDPPAP